MYTHKLDSIAFGALPRPSSIDMKSYRSTATSMLSYRRDSPEPEFLDPTILNPINILTKYRLFPFHQDQMKDKELQIFLEQINPLEAFETLKQLHIEIARLRLENTVLKNFLEEHDPKALTAVNIQHDFNHVSKYLQKLLESNLNNDTQSDISRKSAITKRSRNLHRSLTRDTGASIKTARTELRVTNETKQSMTEKLLDLTTKRIATLTKHSKQEIFVVRAKKEELNLRLAEIQKLKENFLLHFDESLSAVPHLHTKFIHFTDKLIKNSNALVAQSRLTFGTLDEKCKDLLAAIITKRDLRKLLCGADFEQLLIRKEKLQQELIEHTEHEHVLKGQIAAASSNLNAQNRLLKEDEDKHTAMINHTESLKRSKEKLKKEIEHFERSINKRRDQMISLKKQLEMWSAPTAQDLIDRKFEACTLEKEIKILQRKIGIMRIQMPRKSIKKNQF